MEDFMGQQFCKWAIFLCVFTFSVFAAEEKIPRSLLVRLLPVNPVIIEAGAQLGEDTGWMSELWKGGTIYAFEPNPTSYEQLKSIAEGCHNVVAEPLALSDKTGEAYFYLAGGASSLLKPTKCFNDVYFHSDLDRPIKVEKITLDEWAARRGITAIDFLWLDMEGNELNALRGASSILKSVKAIYTEVNFQKFWEGCVTYPELKKWLENEGFVNIWEDIVPDWQGNVVFVRND